jgi:hypothetical protein
MISRHVIEAAWLGRTAKCRARTKLAATQWEEKVNRMAHSVWRYVTDHNNEQHRIGHCRCDLRHGVGLLALMRRYIRDSSKLKLRQPVLEIRNRVWQLLRAGVLA